MNIERMISPEGPEDSTHASAAENLGEIASQQIEGISSVEEFYSEYERVDAFLDDLEKDTQGNFHVYKQGFWPKFIQAIETRFDRDVSPNLRLSIDERRKDGDAPQAQADAELVRRFLRGNANIPTIPFVFSARIATRGAFQECVELGLVDKSDRQIFMDAMPHWKTGFGVVAGHQQGKLLVDVLKKETENRTVLRKKLDEKNVDQKVDDILGHYKERLETFWGAVKGWPDTFDKNTTDKSLRRYGLYNRTLLSEVDEEAVREYIQHMSPSSMAETLAQKGINITPHNLDDYIVGEIEHGFTHAAHIPASLQRLDQRSQEETTLILGKGSDL